MTSRTGRSLLILVALAGVGVLLWLMASPALPPVGPLDPVDPLGPADPEPPQPIQETVRRLQVHVELLSLIPEGAPPLPLYAGVELSHRGSLEVVTVEGQPWPGEVKLEVLAGPAAGRTLVAGSGIRLTGLPEGLSLADVRIPGWPVFRRYLRLRPQGTFGLIGPSAPPCLARGRVFGPDGRPLGGVAVEVDGRRALSDGDGDFALDEVVPGEALFSFSAPGCAPALQGCMVGLAYPPRPPLFVLHSGVEVRGQVVFPDRPSQGVEVFLLPAGQGPGGPRFPYALLGSVRTGMDGNFSFPALPAGERFLVWAQGADLTAEGAGVEIGPLEAGGRPGPVLVKLRRLPRVGGLVRSAGLPVAGALVRTGPAVAWRSGQARLPGEALADLHGALVAREVFYPLHRETRTDAEGRFFVALATPVGAPAVLDCLAPGFLPQRLERIRPGQELALDLAPEGEAGEGSCGLALERPPGVDGEIRLVLRLDRQAARPEEAWSAPDRFEVALEQAGIYRVSIRWRDGPAWQTHEETLVVRGARSVPWPF